MFGDFDDFDDYDGYLAPEPDSADVTLERADDLYDRLREYERATFLLDEDAWAAGQ